MLDYIVDDAFIHLTFARNIAGGNGFAFNPGEPTYGITAPLWTLLLAFLALLFTPGMAMAKGLSVICGLLTIPALYKLAGTAGLKPRYAGMAALVWSVNVWFVRWSASGMEATLAVLLLILAFNAQLRNRSVEVGVWTGLAILSRPETAGLVALFAVDRLLRNGWKPALYTAVIAILVILPWQIYALSTFDTLLPNPLRVKSDIGLPLFSDFWLGLQRTVGILFLSNSLEIVICALGLGFLIRKSSTPPDEQTTRIIALFAIWAIFPGVIYLSRGVFIQSRYLLIGLPPLIIGAFGLIQYWTRRDTTFKLYRLVPWITGLLVAQQLSLMVLVTLPHVAAFNPTITALRRMSDYLETSTPTNSSVAVGDVGVVGFYSRRYLIDLEGLVSHQIIPYRTGRHLEEVITDRHYWKVHRPDYIIDKSRDSLRLSKNNPQIYRLLFVEPVPGGLVGTEKEEWYYSLYAIDY